MATELEQIARRIEARAALDAQDRARQRELIRQRSDEGAKWDEIMAEAKVSRPTINKALKGHKRPSKV